MSFKYIMSYFDKLVSFMNGINPNVNWNNILNEIINMPINKMYGRIKTYVWTDKNEINELDPITKNTFMYYTNLFYEFHELLFDSDCYVIVVGPPTDDYKSNIINELINNKMAIKFNVLCQLLNFKMFKFQILNNHTYEELLKNVENYKRILIFPTCSILYSEPNKLVDGFLSVPLTKATIVNDGYYNIYSTDADLEFNLFRLSVVELFNDPTLDINELLNKKYGMLKINNNDGNNDNDDK